MSLTRGFFNDFEPLFRLVQEPSGNLHNGSLQQANQHHRQAHVEVKEEGDNYSVRAEVPGVQKENLELHVGNDGKSLTIEGHVHRTNRTPPSGAQSPQAKDTPNQEASSAPEKTETYEYRSTFSRTVWFPHAVDGTKAEAKLVDGVLDLRLPERTESGRQKISLL